MQTTSDLISSGGEPIPLRKEDFESLIHQYQSEGEIDSAQAWLAIKYEVWAHLQRQTLPKGWNQNRVVTPEMEREMQQGIESDASAAQDSSIADVPPTRMPFDFAISEALLTEEQKARGLSVVQGLVTGEISHAGEHPDAELLRKGYARSAGILGMHVKGVPILSPTTGKQLQFPLFASPKTRIMPADFNQTSLFHVASNNTPRRFFKDELLGTIGNSVSLHFYGEELRHDDEATFTQLLHIARGCQPYHPIEISNIPFIRGATGTSRILGSKDTNSIEESLLRMRGAFVVVKNNKRKAYIAVSLIKDLSASGSQRSVIIDPCIIVLLDSFASMDLQTLYKLKNVPKQIYKYLSTKPHAQIYPIKIVSFFEICYGSTESLLKHYRLRNPRADEKKVSLSLTKKISDFRCKTLPAALKELKELGHIVDYSIDEVEDKVSITKSVADQEEDEGGQ